MTLHAGREPDRPTIDAEPRILPLAAVRPNSVRAIVDHLVERESAVHAAVRVSLDGGGEGQEIDVDSTVVRDLLEPLVAAAFANAAATSRSRTTVESTSISWPSARLTSRWSPPPMASRWRSPIPAPTSRSGPAFLRTSATRRRGAARR